jgi:biopolymer transport protein ExbB
MKQSVFTITLLVLALAVSVVIYFYMLPTYIRDGGPIVILLLALSIMVITFIIERTLSLRRAEGKGALQKFLHDLVELTKEGKFQEAIEMCKRQQGACANVLQAALERYLVVQRKGMSLEKQVAEVKRMIEEATALETPLLEKNLLAISTIASIATMVGLFGTTLGMIRSFRALASTGAPDAVQLSLGISEALVNTAGGLFAAITAIVAYNVFVNKVDNMTFMLDEAAFEIVEIIGGEEEEGK